MIAEVGPRAIRPHADRVRDGLRKLKQSAKPRDIGYARHAQSWRKRRTSYSSGRKEVIGAIHNTFKPKRKVRDSLSTSIIARTDLRSKHRWRRY